MRKGLQRQGAVVVGQPREATSILCLARIRACAGGEGIARRPLGVSDLRRSGSCQSKNGQGHTHVQLVRAFTHGYRAMLLVCAMLVVLKTIVKVRESATRDVAWRRNWLKYDTLSRAHLLTCTIMTRYSL